MEKQRNGIEQREEEFEIDLIRLFKGMWRSFRRMWWLAIIFVLAGTVGVPAVQRFVSKPMYACSATFTVATRGESSGSYSFYYDQSTADQLSLTFPYILDSSFFQSALREKLGTDALNGTITAETISGSNVVTMRAESPSPDDACAILNGALEIYPETARFVLGEIQFNMLNEPKLPKTPYNQMSIRKGAVLGALGGLFAAAVIFGIMALLRRTVQSPDEMKQISSLRCLGVLPHVHFKARKNQEDLRISVLDHKLQFGYRESMRSLGNRIKKNLARSGGNVILVTSTTAGEGKSTIAVNLAEMLASEGYRTLFIDGDLRKQGDAVLLGVTGGSLRDAAGSEDKAGKDPVIRIGENGMWFLGSSDTVRQPAPVLSSRETARYIRRAARNMDYVILDSPPCAMFQDAAILAEYADEILYVVKYDQTPQQKIREGLAFLKGGRAVLGGYVLNDFPETGGEYGYGRYGYGKYGYSRYGYGKYGYGRNGDEKTEDEQMD